MTDTQIKTQFRAVMQRAVEDALGEITAAIREDRPIGRVSNWKRLSWSRRNGMPWFLNDRKVPLSYADVFHPFAVGKKIMRDPSLKFQSFDELEKMILDDAFLRERLIPPKCLESEKESKDAKFWARILPKDIAERYVSVYGTSVFDEERFCMICDEVEESIFEETLYFDLWIPILCVNFTFDELRIDENARIAKMSKEFHLARYDDRLYGTGCHKQVLACATHALVLENLPIKNRNRFELWQVLQGQDAYPRDKIDLFFGSIRAMTGLDTGYCQLLIAPKGWALSWKANLPPLEGTSLRAYPGFIENFYWLKDDLPSLNVDEASTCGIAFRRLREAKENSLAIAIRRLNRCYCRDDKEDLLIDATIALEALLSDDETQEMTHKLAMRVAAISQLAPNQTKSAQQVFNDIKAVYRLRSKIVHGKAPKEKDRIIGASVQEHRATSEIAREHLRNVIRVMIDHSEFRSGKSVDQLLLSRVTATHLGHVSPS